MGNGESSYRRFLSGDDSAFGDIMDEYRRGLILFVNRYLNDPDASEDIAVEVFTYVFVNPGKYNFKVSLKTYLYMLGRSRALNVLKHRKVIEFVPLSEAENIPSKDKTPEGYVIEDERKRLVNTAMEKLPEDMRTAVYLVYFEELSYKETAKVMKKSEKQVDNLLYRAKKELHTILGKSVDKL